MDHTRWLSWLEVCVGLLEASLQAVMEAGTKYSDGIGFRYSLDLLRAHVAT